MEAGVIGELLATLNLSFIVILAYYLTRLYQLATIAIRT